MPEETTSEDPTAWETFVKALKNAWQVLVILGITITVGFTGATFVHSLKEEAEKTVKEAVDPLALKTEENERMGVALYFETKSIQTRLKALQLNTDRIMDYVMRQEGGALQEEAAGAQNRVDRLTSISENYEDQARAIRNGSPLDQMFETHIESVEMSAVPME